MGNIYFPQFKKGKNGLKIDTGLTLLELARTAGIEISAECGGIGKCGKCIVRIDKGEENLNMLTPSEEKFNLKEKERLACQTKLLRDTTDMTVYIKNFGEYEILQHGVKRELPICSVYHKNGDKIFKDGEPVDDYKGKLYGLAVDIGTTTVVFNLVDMEDGEVLGAVAKTNPQISYGNDVISRIEYTLVDKENGSYFKKAERMEKANRLRMIVAELFNEAIQEFSDRIKEDISPYIYETVIVGNPTMRNIFCGLDIPSLGIMPYEAAHKEAIIRSPEEAGLKINKIGRVYGGAIIGGHVGADIVADVLTSEMYKSKEISLIIDIGTNGEVVLGNQERMISASCAAGGAFEGAAVSCGLGGIEGAIKKIEIVNGRTLYATIGDKEPIGVCGSGLIDLLAELLKKGIMNRKARIEKDFLITGDLKLTQSDIFQLITSKAAIKTGWEILLKNYPLKLSEVKKIYLSGGFGNYIDIKNAMEIGLIPKVDESRVIKIGNGSLEGAREILLCKESQRLSEEMAKKIVHIKTNEVEKNFEYLMAENMYF